MTSYSYWKLKSMEQVSFKITGIIEFVNLGERNEGLGE